MVIPVQIHIANQNWLFKIGPKTGYHSIHSLIIIPKLTSYLVPQPRVISLDILFALTEPRLARAIHHSCYIEARIGPPEGKSPYPFTFQ